MRLLRSCTTAGTTNRAIATGPPTLNAQAMAAAAVATVAAGTTTLDPAPFSTASTAGPRISRGPLWGPALSGDGKL